MPHAFVLDPDNDESFQIWIWLFIGGAHVDPQEFLLKNIYFIFILF